MTEIWFYHLEKTPLMTALPELLEKVLQKPWRAYVFCGDEQRLLEADANLWSYRDDAFMGHGLEDAPFAGQQPVLLGKSGQPVNAADVFVAIGPDALPDLSGYARALILFEGDDDDHLNWARGQWRRLKAGEDQLAYWKQNVQGRWEKMN